MSLLLLLCATVTFSAANLVTHVKHERSYNDVDFFEYATLKDLTTAFFNEEGRIATSNVLLGNTRLLSML
jgi:hypothetical protein